MERLFMVATALVFVAFTGSDSAIQTDEPADICESRTETEGLAGTASAENGSAVTLGAPDASRVRPTADCADHDSPRTISMYVVSGMAEPK